MTHLRLALLALVLAGTAGCPGPTPPPADAGADTRPRDAGVCATDADCDDGLFCNGDEACDGGGCVPGTAPDCADTVACTVDRCSEERSRCENVAPDVDGDGYGDLTCAEAGGNDCDDDDALRYPGAAEVCDEMDRDEDCDAATFGMRDVDGDGAASIECCNDATCGTDCNDTSAEARPGGTETCNGIDDDCNGTIDEGVAIPRYVDADRDGFGVGTAVMGCAGIPGFAADDGDCDDTPGTGIARNPSQPEICDGLDNDCNDTVDDGTRPVPWYRDADGDGFGSASSGTTSSCAPVAGYSLVSTDCDDTSASRSPAAAEVCNATDDDCNGRADFAVGPGDFEDDDRDGAPDGGCGTAVGVDCDDSDPATLAGSAEICDGRDNDCDGTSDEGATTAVFFRDADGDGFGSDAGGAVVACAVPTGFSVRGGDCDDLNPVRSPRAADTCNGADDDCDGTADEAAANATCATLPGVVTGVCIAGACDYDRCSAGSTDCDGERENGCEARTDMDPTRCGGCERSCGSFSESTAWGCAAGECTATCLPGYQNCDGIVANGCETTAASCPTCGGTMTSCFGTCADLDTDPLHCGSCTSSCGAGGSCTAGECDAAIRVAVGQSHSCVLRSGGGVACWGSNFAGELGVAFSSGGPTTVPLAAPAFDLTCGTSHCCAALVDGRTVECWGSNAALQLGESGSFPAGSHSTVMLPETVVRVVAGFRHTVAILASGDAMGWGENGSGQISGTGSGPVTPTTVPVANVDADSVAAGNTFTCFARRFAEPLCVGQMGSYFGTSGTAHTLANDDPGYPDGSFAGAGAGLDHVCFVTGNGVWCAGAESDGQLGRTGVPPRLVLTPFPALSRAVGATLWSTCVASATGVVWCSGNGTRGELGPTSGGSSSPIRLETSLRATAISSGDTRHFCAIDPAGRVWCWGQNFDGECGPTAPPIAPGNVVVGL